MKIQEKLKCLLMKSNHCEIEFDDYVVYLYMTNDGISYTEVKFQIDNKLEKKEIICSKILTDNEVNELLNMENVKNQINKLYIAYTKTNKLKNTICKNFIDILTAINIKEEDKQILIEIINYCYKYDYYNIDNNIGISLVDPVTKTIGFKLINLNFDKYKVLDNELEIINELIRIKHLNHTLFINNVFNTINNIEEDSLVDRSI